VQLIIQQHSLWLQISPSTHWPLYMSLLVYTSMYSSFFPLIFSTPILFFSLFLECSLFCFRFTSALNITDMNLRGAGRKNSIFEWTVALANTSAGLDVLSSPPSPHLLPPPSISLSPFSLFPSSSFPHLVTFIRFLVLVLLYNLVSPQLSVVLLVFLLVLLVVPSFLFLLFSTFSNLQSIKLCGLHFLSLM
jgi:hypothetical protein